MTIVPHPTTLTLVTNQRLAALRAQADRDRLADFAERTGQTGRRLWATRQVVVALVVVTALLLAAGGKAVAGRKLGVGMDRLIVSGVAAAGGSGPIDVVVGHR